MQYIRKSMFVT